jgi:triosephosphate isomerase
MSKKLLVIANWKMNPDSPGRAVRLAKEIERGTRGIKNVSVVVAPPHPFLESVGKVLKKAKLGAQNLFWEDVGPYTGEVSWHQLKQLRITYVIIGHSERRIYFGETDSMINKKVRAALKAGLIPVLAVGERKKISNKKNPAMH